jgi:MFS transporter, DHA1 family, multidrug resistance protein
MSIELIDDDKRATAMGTYQAIYAIGMFGGPYFAGILNSMMGIRSSFYFAGILGMIAMVLILLWNNKEMLAVNDFELKGRAKG